MKFPKSLRTPFLQNLFKVQFLSFSRKNIRNFSLQGLFFLVLQLKCLSECSNSKKTPLLSQIPGHMPVVNGFSTGYSTKKMIHKFFGTALKKNMNMLHAQTFSFIILNLVKKLFWTFMLLQLASQSTSQSTCFVEHFEGKL